MANTKGNKLVVTKATEESSKAMLAEAQTKLEKGRLDLAEFTAPAGSVDHFKGKKTKKISMAPIIKWKSVPVGSALVGKLIRGEESPNDKLANSPMLRFESSTMPGREYLVGLSGGLLKPLGIKRGGTKKGEPSTLDNAAEWIEANKGKLVSITLTGFIGNKMKEGNPEDVAIFDIVMEE